MAEQKKIRVVLEEPLKLEPYYEATSLTSDLHGPFRFSTTGVAFGTLEDPFFLPWAKVSGVRGWEPPERVPQPVDEATRRRMELVEQHLKNEAVEREQQKGKFKP